MDVRLQNAYVEVLLGNFMEVVKQNLMFQAQIEVGKNSVQESEDSVRRLKEVSDANIEYQNQLVEKDKVINASNIQYQNQLVEKDKIINQLTTERDNLKSSSGNNDSLRQEKDRLQSAVNDYMRQLKSAQQELLVVKSESQDVLMQNNNRIEELTKYVARLETVVPANKLKKVKLGEVIQPDTPEITVEEPVLPIDDIVKSGGTF
jgi:chromosome segregation ATPase